MIETGTTLTYRVTIHFQDGRPVTRSNKAKYDHDCPACRASVEHRMWSKGGYSFDAAQETKDHFLTSVPPAVFGSMEPERTAR